MNSYASYQIVKDGLGRWENGDWYLPCRHLAKDNTRHIVKCNK
jgi:hypothetical protein